VQVHTAEVGNSLMQFVLSLYTSFQVQGTGNSSFAFSISPYNLLWPFIRKSKCTTHHPHYQSHYSSNYQLQHRPEHHYSCLNFQPSLDSEDDFSGYETLASTNRPSQGSFHLNDHMPSKYLVQATACWKEVELPSRNSIWPTEVSLILKSPVKFCNMYCNLCP